VTTDPLRDAFGDYIVKGGLLSSLQLEGVLYACQRHTRFLPGAGTPTRAAFFLGDGAGVGKGRQMAAVILDNFARGRKKHIWFSVSTDLRLDSERDLKDICAAGISVIDGCKGLDMNERTSKTGVVFSTYATLVSATSGGKAAPKGGGGAAKRQKVDKKRRLDQLIEWCGGEEFDGCLIFDECHKAKNFKEGGDGPYWLNGYVPLVALLNDTAYIAALHSQTEYVLAQAAANDGWLGPLFEKSRPVLTARGRDDFWQVYRIMGALCQYAELAPSDNRKFTSNLPLQWPLGVF
jgi:hypothetical protein